MYANIGLRIFAVSIGILAGLSACGPRDARYNPLHFRITGAAAPPEIVLPKDVKPGAKIFGITTSKPDFEGLCCVADARVSVPVRKAGPASTLRIGVYVPPDKTQRFRVTFPGGFSEHRDSAKQGKGGLIVFAFPLPRELRERRGIVPITIDASQAPYVLVSIFFE